MRCPREAAGSLQHRSWRQPTEGEAMPTTSSLESLSNCTNEMLGKGKRSLLLERRQGGTGEGSEQTLWSWTLRQLSSASKEENESRALVEGTISIKRAGQKQRRYLEGKGVVPFEAQLGWGRLG